MVPGCQRLFDSSSKFQDFSMLLSHLLHLNRIPAYIFAEIVLLQQISSRDKGCFKTAPREGAFEGFQSTFQTVMRG